MRRFFACVLILLLGGCGLAVSEKPMFAATDTVGAPRFADGIWLLKDDAECRFDAAEPMSRWPDCAYWAEYRDGRWSEPVDKEGLVMKPLENDILLVGGKIALMQIGFEADSSEWDGPTFLFMAFDNRAKGGKLKSLALWPVMCGTMVDYKDAAERRDPMPAVKQRYPGFDEKCRPESQAALRAAASASRPDRSKLTHLQWLRERLD